MRHSGGCSQGRHTMATAVQTATTPIAVGTSQRGRRRRMRSGRGASVGPNTPGSASITSILFISSAPYGYRMMTVSHDLSRRRLRPSPRVFPRESVSTLARRLLTTPSTT